MHAIMVKRADQVLPNDYVMVEQDSGVRFQRVIDSRPWPTESKNRILTVGSGLNSMEIALMDDELICVRGRRLV